jgi:hypothetical protein
MELLKRTIKQALTTGTTESCTGHCHVIIPDLSAVYHFTFLLTAEKHDMGFFDPYFEVIEEITTTTTTTTTISPSETYYALDDDGDIFLDDDNSKFEWI